MNLSFRLTPRAYDDFKNIARYTRQLGGERQRERYLRALDDRFRWLAENPRSGKRRPDDAIDTIGVPLKHTDVPSYFGEIRP